MERTNHKKQTEPTWVSRWLTGLTALVLGLVLFSVGIAAVMLIIKLGMVLFG